MIRSMTAFGAGRAESSQSSLSIELRGVNSRFLDLNFRIPEDLRALEGPLREQISQALVRGKIDIRVNFASTTNEAVKTLDPAYLAAVTEQLQAARRLIPDVPAPHLSELLKGGACGDTAVNFDVWAGLCTQAAAHALSDFQANREREGARLAQGMLESAAAIGRILDEVELGLPHILSEHQKKLSAKLHDALDAACPGGFAQISGAELTARVAQEASIFSLRIDVAEELARLRSHIGEMQHLLGGEGPAPLPGKTPKTKGKPGSAGKRLDFLLQEMNREANTLGSKAGGLSVTHAAIDLKLLIEQLREQTQNIE